MTEEINEPVLIEDNEQLAKDPKAPLLAQLRAERNRWFAMCLSSFSLIALLVMFCWYAFAKAERNQEIIYVKLEPNGAWSVIDYEPDDGQLFFKTTIDASLERYVMARYKSDPATIATDWGEASAFMSPEMAEYFISPTGFDAWAKIEQLQNSKTKAEIEIRDTEHYDQVDYQFDSGQSSKVIRSNVYFTRTMTVNGKKHPPESLVLSVQWRLISKEALVKHPKARLRLNPIGVEILTEQLKKERSSE